MERLTDKNHSAVNRCGEYTSCYSCHREKCYISELADKLGEFEDFMEEYGFESLKELESALYQLNVEASKTKELEQENQALKDCWEKLKDFIDTFKEHNIDQANQAWKILTKMQELEIADLIRRKEK